MKYYLITYQWKALYCEWQPEMEVWKGSIADWFERALKQKYIWVLLNAEEINAEEYKSLKGKINEIRNK